MIVYSKERFLPTTPNVLVLMDKNEGYYYVHRDVYDMAVVLADRHDLASMKAIVERENNPTAVNYFYEQAPKPINVLAPFIGLVTGDLENDVEILAGVLHAISGATNLREYTKLKKELRKSISFSLTVKEEYEMAWDRFFNTSVPYDERAALGARMPGYMQQPAFDPTAMMAMMGSLGGGVSNAQPAEQKKTGESHSHMAIAGEPNRSKEAGAHETGDVVDEEDITTSPDWTVVAPGVYYNEVTGDTAFVESDEIGAEEEKYFADLPINKKDSDDDAKPTAKDHKSSVQDEEKSEQRAALGLPISRRRK